MGRKRRDEHIIEVDGVWYITQSFAALLCDTSVQSLITWGKQENPPPYNNKIKMYPIKQLGDWIRKEQIFKRGRGNGFPYLPDLSRLPNQGSMPGMSGPAASKDDEERRRIKLQADKIELDIAERKRNLVPIQDIAEVGARLASVIRTRLLRIPVALAPLVRGQTDVYEIQERLENGIREALEDLSDNWYDRQSIGDGEEGESGDG